jgi:GH18 family chitinase
VATYDRHLHVWRQTYYDTAQSLGSKYALAKTHGLAGVGLWALGYDAGSSLNWQVLARAFQRPPAKAHPVPRKIHKIVHKVRKHLAKPKVHPAKHAPAKVAPVHLEVSKAL